MRYHLGNLPDVRRRLAKWQLTMQEYWDASEDERLPEMSRVYAMQKFVEMEDRERMYLDQIKDVKRRYPSVFAA